MKPANVQIHRANGTTLTCELAHPGLNADGIDVWEIANATYQRGDCVTGVVGAATALRFTVADDIADDIAWCFEDPEDV